MHPSVKDTSLARESGVSRHENRGEGMHVLTDTDAAREFADIVGESQLLTGERIGRDYHHNEVLVGESVAPRFVALWCMDQIRGSRKMSDHVGGLRRTDREIGRPKHLNRAAVIRR
jgi:hypothetical protein